jgi:hypothetical protein
MLSSSSSSLTKNHQTEPSIAATTKTDTTTLMPAAAPVDKPVLGLLIAIEGLSTALVAFLEDGFR